MNQAIDTLGHEITTREAEIAKLDAEVKQLRAALDVLGGKASKVVLLDPRQLPIPGTDAALMVPPYVPSTPAAAESAEREKKRAAQAKPRRGGAIFDADSSALRDAITRQVAASGGAGCKAGAIAKEHDLNKGLLRSTLAEMVEMGLLRKTGVLNGTRYVVGSNNVKEAAE